MQRRPRAETRPPTPARSIPAYVPATLACISLLLGWTAAESGDTRSAGLAGRVVDPEGTPRGGVLVEVIGAGRLLGKAQTDSTGRYETTFSYDAESDPTVIACFQAGDLGCWAALLRLSERAARGDWYSPCFPTLPLGPATRLDLKLRSREDQVAWMRRCMADSSANREETPGVTTKESSE